MTDKPVKVILRETPVIHAMQFRANNVKDFLDWAQKAFGVSSTPKFMMGDDGNAVDGFVWLGRHSDGGVRVHLNEWAVSTTWGPHTMSELEFAARYKVVER